MSIKLGDIAPDFIQSSTEGQIQFHKAIEGHWAILFSHPKVFTPVCTTELGQLAKLKPKFDSRKVKVLALSVDNVNDQEKWAEDIYETQGARPNYPVIADEDRKVSTLYDMIHPNANDTLTVRSVYIIDPNKKVRLILTYPASTGRNFDEILRVLDSMQLTDSHKVATPVDWKDGDDVIIVPALQDEATLKALFPKGWNAPKPYLRITPQPNK